MLGKTGVLVLRAFGISFSCLAFYFLVATAVPAGVTFLTTGLWLAHESRSLSRGELTPVSTVALVSLTLALILSWAFALAFYWPSPQSIGFIWKHYIGPVTPALLFLVLPLLRSGSLRSFEGIGLLGSGVFSFAAIVFIHFNFKLWAQLINPLRLDGFYQSIDTLCSPVITVLQNLRAAFALLPEVMKHPYHEIFVGMFIVSFAAHALKRQTEILSRLTTTISIVLVLGGLSYMIAPAWGPFVFAPSMDPETAEIQREMAAFQEQFNRSNGTIFNGSKFVAALAAMPSLHLAHAFVFLLFGLRYLKPLGVAYIPCFVFIMTEAVTGKWHYLIDLPAGIGVALASLKISDYLYLKQGRADGAFAPEFDQRCIERWRSDTRPMLQRVILNSRRVFRNVSKTPSEVPQPSADLLFTASDRRWTQYRSRSWPFPPRRSRRDR